jgi:hypothetical protein
MELDTYTVLYRRSESEIKRERRSAATSYDVEGQSGPLWVSLYATV